MQALAPLRAAAVAAAFVLLAGCTMPGDSTTSTTTTAAATGAPTGAPTSAGVVLNQDSYTVTITQFAGRSSPELSQADNFTWPEIRNGTEFTFIEKVEGSAGFDSDHIGGHFGKDADAAAAPSTTVYPIACVHQSGHLPGTYTITCTAPKATGTYHLRGHARATQASGQLNWWSSDLAFRVV